MVDAAQVIILIVIFVLTVLLLVLGTQVYFILKELRRTVKKANKVLDDAGIITESVTGPVSAISALTTGIKTGTFFAKLLKKKKRLLDIFTGSDEKKDGAE